MDYKAVQSIAKETIEYIKTEIRANMNLLEIRKLCEDKMLCLGADSFWYWDVGAFVFSGDETALSVSGKTYQTANKTIAENDIITIDLSPQIGTTWGDFARTIIIENGNVVNEVSNIKNAEWKNGILMEDLLHNEFCKFVTPNNTFEELYFYMNDLIIEKGFVNLDFLGNLGHSIVEKKSDRTYIEKGNHQRIGDVKYFTFEPHISVDGSKYGYKKENIYYFENGSLKIL